MSTTKRSALEREFINKTDIGEITGLSRTIVEGIIGDPTFPTPVSFTKRTMWRRDKVVAWIAARS